jgi:transcriptional regulator with XRE-family HTH domain
MSTATLGDRVAQTQYDPEDVRIGETLQALMFRTEVNEMGFVIRRKIKHEELAQSIKLPGKPNGVSRSYVSQLCTGAKHMNNEMLYAIARYLGVNPIAIKRPDMDRELVAA